MPTAGAEVWWTLVIGTSALLTLSIFFVTMIVVNQRRFITVERQKLEALRQREQRFRSLIENSFDAIVLLDFRGSVLYASQSTERVLGYTPEALKTVQATDLLSLPDYQTAKALFEMCRDTPNVRHELQMRVRHRNGQWRTLDGVATNLIHDADVGAIVINYRDITDRKRAEEERRESEERFRKGFEDGPIGMILIGKDKRIFRANQALCDMIGYSAEELIGRTLMEISHPDDVEADLALAEKVFRGEIPHYKLEKRLVGKNGKPVWVNVTATVIRDAEGGVLYGLGLAENITARKQAEAELRKSYQQLRDLSSRLQTIREDERSHIAREIHDELGQMLTVLKMDLALVERKIYDGDSSRNHPAIFEQLEAMANMIDNIIRSVRRIATELRPEVLDELGLKEAIEWELDMFRERSGMGAQFLSNLNEVNLDRNSSTALFRIFQETLTNILRHAQATEVSVVLEIRNGKLLLQIQDNGRGITEKELTGAHSLGILGMRERAMIMGGEVTIIGEAGRGTLVTVRVPVDSLHFIPKS
jgi:PAS domain S-box-containing protein